MPLPYLLNAQTCKYSFVINIALINSIDVKKRSERWGKGYKDNRNWREYNEQLVVRGEFYLDISFSDGWFMELGKMNDLKRGGQFKIPKSLMKWLVVWKQLVDYRVLE
ncbi:MAG: hypothetical protein QXO75_11335 [Nitrososphaerota archaeon]